MRADAWKLRRGGCARGGGGATLCEGPAVPGERRLRRRGAGWTDTAGRRPPAAHKRQARVEYVLWMRGRWRVTGRLCCSGGLGCVPCEEGRNRDSGVLGFAGLSEAGAAAAAAAAPPAHPGSWNLEPSRKATT